jgi:1,4-alpha-glucan branching enzyme
VWAPNAQRVSVIGSFNGWDGGKHPMQAEENGHWFTDVAEAHIGDQYRYLLTTAKGEFKRIDPYAREVTHSVGNAIVHDPSFDWEGDDFHLARRNELVIYELHVGTFNDEEDDNLPGKFASVSSRLGHLKKLGVNAIQIMPIAQFAGARSWGYNPAHIYSVELAYGGPLAFKKFVKRAHSHGIAVILDVVYNHLGPEDLDLWQFDGWSENDHGGIYFYNDDRAHTPWGDTRPDYGRNEVRQYIFDNVFMWLDEYHVDGLRFDGTAYIHSFPGPGGQDLPEGWTLLRWINSMVAEKFPGRMTIAEDSQNNKWLTKDVGAGGAGFGSQWDAEFVHPIRQAVITHEDQHRSVIAIRDALCYRYNDDAFRRVIYSESHDEVARPARVPQRQPGTQGWAPEALDAVSRHGLYGPGSHALPGQEFLEGEWFRDTVLSTGINVTSSAASCGWPRPHPAAAQRDGFTRGLCGQFTQVYHLHDDRKVLAYRWDKGGPADDVVVVANFLHEPQDGYVIGFPSAGTWTHRFNSDWRYSDDFEGHPSTDVVAEPGAYHGFPQPRRAVHWSLQRSDLFAMSDRRERDISCALRPEETKGERPMSDSSAYEGLTPKAYRDSIKS